MAADKAATKPAKKRQLSVPPAVIAIAALLVLGLAGIWYLDRASKQPSAGPPPLSGAAREYVRHGFLRLSDAGMEAHESYLHQQVVEITGNIQNAGDRVLDLVEINCVFRDAYGQIVLRERMPIVSRKMGRLAPGEAKPFRMAFDSIPESWNQAMPELVIARIDFT